MKVLKILTLAMCSYLMIPTMQGATKHAKETKYPSYKGMIMAGYQGWFGTPEDGKSGGFRHMAGKNGFKDGSCHIDIWPDVREYSKTYPTEFKNADGSTARIFSSYDASTTDLHFKWMKEYGIDGVFMQRFFDYARGRGEQSLPDIILKNAFDAASKYDRAIAIMYDLSGLRHKKEDCSVIIEDWKYLVDKLNVTNQNGNKTYLLHNKKPVVAIWGLGFTDRPYKVNEIGIEKLIDFLQNDPVYGGCAVMLGVPTAWRDLNFDCTNDPYLHTIIKKADLLLPWTVQRYTPLLHNDMNRYHDETKADIQWCKKNKIDYVPCVTPGFSWHNLSTIQFPDDIKPSGSIPRQGGKFFWDQMYNAMKAGGEMIYVAMFDEIDEGTAIFKCTDTPPVTKISQFIGMDGKPSDHYLWLTGKATQMLQKEIPLTKKMPERN